MLAECLEDLTPPQGGEDDAEERQQQRTEEPQHRRRGERRYDRRRPPVADLAEQHPEQHTADDAADPQPDFLILDRLREQVGADRLGEVIIEAGFEASLSVALHRMRRQGQGGHMAAEFPF